MSRSVRDTAAALDAIAGAEIGAPYAPPPRPDSYLARLTEPFGRPLRIAKWSTGWDDAFIAAECLDAVRMAEYALRELGHEVVEAPLPKLNASFVEALIEVLANIVVAVNGKVRGRPIDEWQHLLEPALLDGYRIGSTLSAEQYALAITRFHNVGRILGTYIGRFDFILTPTLTKVPPLLGEISTHTDFRSFRENIATYTSFLAIINASGQPAANVPLHWTDAGLPIGIQLIGRFGDEDGILRLAAQLERVAP